MPGHDPTYTNSANSERLRKLLFVSEGYETTKYCDCEQGVEHCCEYAIAICGMELGCCKEKGHGGLHVACSSTHAIVSWDLDDD